MSHFTCSARSRALRLFGVALALSTACGGHFALANDHVRLVDTIYVNGSIITMDGEESIAEGFAVRGDEFVAVGSNETIRSLASAETRIVDLGGHAVVPGMYAAHDHFPGAGMFVTKIVDLGSPPMGTMNSIDDIVAALSTAAANTPDGEWIQGSGYDDTLIREGRHPTRHDLDRVSTTHPIWITHSSGHLGVANSLALEMAGITSETPNPEGGVIRKDAQTGEPDGVFEEAGGLVRRFIPPMSPDERIATISAASDLYIEQGVTTTVIMMTDPTSINDLQLAEDQGLLDLRVIAMSYRGEPDQPTYAETAGLLPGFGSDHLRLGGVKIVQDGSNQGYTGYFSEPYHTPFHGDANWRGYPRRSQEALNEMVSQLHREGYQIAIHGNGDAAIDQIIEAFRLAQEEFSRADARHRIEHNQVVRMEQLEEIRDLGISPSFFVAHVYYWGDRHRDIFMGPERAAFISPLAAARDLGIRYTVHNDTPVTPVDPLQLVWTSATRETLSGAILGPDQVVSVMEGLRAVTIDAAWQNFEENRKGSIEVGKLADFVVLSDNILTVDPVSIRDISVLETVIGGETVYSADRP